MNAVDRVVRLPQRLRGIRLHDQRHEGAEQGGYLCVATPFKRIAGLNAGNAGPCNGVLSLDFNTYAASGVDPKLVAGTTVHGQYWSRDSLDPYSSNLTNAVSFTLGP